MDNADAERTWPLCVCCALITPSILISGGKNRGRPEKSRTVSQGNKVDFQTGGLQKYRIELYIRSKKVRLNISYKRKVIEKIKSLGGNLRLLGNIPRDLLPVVCIWISYLFLIATIFPITSCT